MGIAKAELARNLSGLRKPPRIKEKDVGRSLPIPMGCNTLDPGEERPRLCLRKYTKGKT